MAWSGDWNVTRSRPSLGTVNVAVWIGGRSPPSRANVAVEPTGIPSMRQWPASSVVVRSSGCSTTRTVKLTMGSWFGPKASRSPSAAAVARLVGAVAPGAAVVAPRASAPARSAANDRWRGAGMVTSTGGSRWVP